MLSDLYQGALQDAAARQEEVSAAALEAIIAERPDPLDALEFLAPSDTIKVIAEVKRASPSKGDLADIADPAVLARQYEAGGASAVSVLTEQRRFKGFLEDLREVRRSVSIPVLRKDFIASEYQILEARAEGADIVLLIVAGLEQPKLEQLFNFAGSLGLTALVETHSSQEVERAVDLGAELIGVNARDLNTFELNKDLFGSVADQMPAGVIRVAESAVQSISDVEHYRAAGADVVLVGEALVKDGDPVAALNAFTAVQ